MEQKTVDAAYTTEIGRIKYEHTENFATRANLYLI